MRKPHTIPAPPERLVNQDVFGMDASGVLAVLVDERRTQDLAAARELRAVTAWADLHRIADPETDGFGALDPGVAEIVWDEEYAKLRHTGPSSVAGPDGIEGQLRLCGQNAYLVTEFAVSELATALSMSEGAARHFVGQALELRDRLPRLWARVMTGQLPAWKARRVAEQTIPLKPETAAWVDSQLEAFAHRLSTRRIEMCVEAAIGRFEPALVEERVRKAAEDRGVWTEHHLDGTSSVTATTHTPDAVAFDHAVAEVASTLAALGDDDELQIRRSKAVGILADPQHTLDLHTEADARWSSSDEAPAEARPSRPRRSTRTSTRPTIHLHVHSALSEAALTGRPCDGSPVGPVVRVDGSGVHGPAALAAVEQWLRDLAPGATVKITPVADLAAKLAVDAYEIPTRIAAQVEHRDLTCQFPWCGRRGRYDHDHIVEYVPLDDDGPPGQTSTDNIARLCRFHHRVKTHSDWTYRREPDDSLTWTSPHHQRYHVDHTGTIHLD